MRLKELRQRAGLSQATLAKELNISQSALSNWESGKRSPDLESLKRIANYFNVSVEYLTDAVLDRDTINQERYCISLSWKKTYTAICTEAVKHHYFSYEQLLSMQDEDPLTSHGEDYTRLPDLNEITKIRAIRTFYEALEKKDTEFISACAKILFKFLGEIESIASRWDTTAAVKFHDKLIAKFEQSSDITPDTSTEE